MGTSSFLAHERHRNRKNLYSVCRTKFNVEYSPQYRHFGGVDRIWIVDHQGATTDINQYVILKEIYAIVTQKRLIAK